MAASARYTLGCYALYFATTEDRRYVKVGISRIPSRRLTSLQQEAFFKLDYDKTPRVQYILVVPLDDAIETEAKILERFCATRIKKSEWFTPSPDLFSYIETLRPQSCAVEEFETEAHLAALQQVGHIVPKATSPETKVPECPRCAAVLTAQEVGALYARLRKTRSGGRNGGRPKSNEPRCPCGKMTAKSAAIHCHKCEVPQ